MTTKLKAVQGFGSFGVTYNPGDEVLPKDLARWPEGTLATRLENGSVAYEDDSEEGSDPRLGAVNTDEARLVAVKPFSAWGKDYNAGDPIPDDHHESWAPGTLATRLQYGDVAFKPASEVDVDTNSAKVTTDSVGALDAGAPKTAVGDNLKDAQPARAKESALQPDAGSVTAEPTEDGERGGAETGVLDELAAKSPQSAAEDLAQTAAGEGEDTDDEEDDASLPPVAQLKEHLESLESEEEIKALQKQDKRKTAKPIYAARLAELKD